MYLLIGIKKNLKNTVYIARFKIKKKCNDLQCLLKVEIGSVWMMFLVVGKTLNQVPTRTAYSPV